MSAFRNSDDFRVKSVPPVLVRVRQVELSPSHRSVLAAHQCAVERHQRENVEKIQHHERGRDTVTVSDRQKIPRRPIRVQIRSKSVSAFRHDFHTHNNNTRRSSANCTVFSCSSPHRGVRELFSNFFFSYEYFVIHLRCPGKCLPPRNRRRQQIPLPPNAITRRV